MTLRFTPKTPIDIATDRGKAIRVSLLSKEEMVVVWLSETEEAGQFNGQFTDVFSKTSESEVRLLERSAPPMSDIHVSNEDHKMMKGLNLVLCLFQ